MAAHHTLIPLGRAKLVPMETIPIDNLVLLLGVSALLPGLTTILTKTQAPDWVKNLVTLLLTAGMAALDQVLAATTGEDFDVRGFALAWVMCFATAALAYTRAWKDSPAHALLAETTRRIGFDGTARWVNQPSGHPLADPADPISMAANIAAAPGQAAVLAVTPGQAAVAAAVMAAEEAGVPRPPLDPHLSVDGREGPQNPLDVLLAPEGPEAGVRPAYGGLRGRVEPPLLAAAPVMPPGGFGGGVGGFDRE